MEEIVNAAYKSAALTLTSAIVVYNNFRAAAFGA